MKSIEHKKYNTIQCDTIQNNTIKPMQTQLITIKCKYALIQLKIILYTMQFNTKYKIFDHEGITVERKSVLSFLTVYMFTTQSHTYTVLCLMAKGYTNEPRAIISSLYINRSALCIFFRCRIFVLHRVIGICPLFYFLKSD